jgi:hypothetical protein
MSWKEHLITAKIYLLWGIPNYKCDYNHVDIDSSSLYILYETQKLSPEQNLGSNLSESKGSNFQFVWNIESSNNNSAKEKNVFVTKRRPNETWLHNCNDRLLKDSLILSAFCFDIPMYVCICLWSLCMYMSLICVAVQAACFRISMDWKPSKKWYSTIAIVDRNL